MSSFLDALASVESTMSGVTEWINQGKSPPINFIQLFDPPQCDHYDAKKPFFKSEIPQKTSKKTS